MDDLSRQHAPAEVRHFYVKLEVQLEAFDAEDALEQLRNKMHLANLDFDIDFIDEFFPD